ncbi:MAG: D-alanine--D-alanine ligase [Halobacteriovoraceae bacterium]|nr:D-alanine--D-alanine ligase [Halobacteriovoraceae bacterium]MCB9095715.1 D-alanine--D-alanine ligase [Halobacteriovoraceae bacterium]
MKKNILVLFGGGGNEHEISIVSKKYLIENLQSNDINIFEVEIKKDKFWYIQDKKVSLNFNKELIIDNNKYAIDFVFPCIHGYPVETGHLQSYLEMIGLPYFGNRPEASFATFNKFVTKLWLENYQIPTTPFISLTDCGKDSMARAIDFFETHSAGVFIKASSEGSSVGCYPTKSLEHLEENIKKAFQYSPEVIIEKLVNARELEVAVYQYRGQTYASAPGEILCPDKFYSYDEKYSEKSQTRTTLHPEALSDQTIKTIKNIALKAFKVLNLRHLSRIDFFYDESKNHVFINEINTLPGMTPISLFPKMMENNGQNFSEWLKSHL